MCKAEARISQGSLKNVKKEKKERKLESMGNNQIYILHCSTGEWKAQKNQGKNINPYYLF